MPGYNAFTHYCRRHDIAFDGGGRPEPHPRYETPPGRQLSSTGRRTCGERLFSHRCVCVDVDAKNRPIGNLSLWDDLLFGLKAAFRSWFIADDGRNELQKSEDSNSRKQIVQLSSRSISVGNLVFSS